MRRIHDMSDENVLSNDELELRWTALREVLDKNGAGACIHAIQSESNNDRRNQLYRLAVRKLGGGVGATAAELDAMMAIGDAAIRDLLEVAAHQPDDAARWEDNANILAYNLSANLCDCWGDGDSRHKRHFETGLRYANQALEMRRKLNKGHGPFSMAYWARGKHLLSLGKPAEAADAFRECVACEISLAREGGAKPDVNESAPAGLLNSRAFLGLSLLRAGDASGQAMLDSALEVLRARATGSDGEERDDAQVYLDQVQESIKRTGSGAF
jgi:hypothetical protein